MSEQVLAGLIEAFPDVQWTVDEQIAEGDKVVSRFHWTGTHAGNFAGIPATGKHVTVKGVVIDRVIDGLLVDSRILEDDLGMLSQLGVMPGRSLKVLTLAPGVRNAPASRTDRNRAAGPDARRTS
jgi:SnoaL-like polyketide cyclase